MLKSVFQRFSVKVKSTVRKRGWDTITASILEATLVPQKKTRIIYKANLNFYCFNRYFNDSLRKGFIVKADDNSGGSSYVISERGRIFLAALRKSQDLASIEEY